MTLRILLLFGLLTSLLVFACAAGEDGKNEPTNPVSKPDEPAASASLPPPGGASAAPTPPSSPPSNAQEPFEIWRHREPIYELYVRHFSATGNFKGVEEKLPELKALGVGIVWLLPVNEIGSLAYIDAPHGNPYAVKSYERLNPEYGTDADLKRLVDRAHTLGMRIILDWVPNHTAWDNPLMQQHPDWYARDPATGKVRPVSDEFSWIAQLDWSKNALREYMIGVMEDWVTKFDIDGFRIDFAHSMPTAFFEQLRPRLEKHKPVFLLAESGRVDQHPAFDMTYDWDVYPLLGDVAHGWKPTSAIDDALLHRQFVPYANQPEALVMRMTYNHDDNGKFTLDDRYNGPLAVKTFAVLACTLPGKPLIFDGQEVGMNVFDGTSTKRSINLGHDPKVKIDWTSDSEGYRPFYTKLLQLFRANPALHQPGMSDFRKIGTSDNRVYSFIRRDKKDPANNSVIVITNLSGANVSFSLNPDAGNVGSIAGDYTDLFTKTKVSIAGSAHALNLGPWAYRVYVRGPIAL